MRRSGPASTTPRVCQATRPDDRRDLRQALTAVGFLREHMFVTGDATILHADLDAFFASVEQRDDPSLRGRPVIVGIGVVMCASYEAQAPAACAGRWAAARRRRLCPDAVFVPPRLSAYTEASKAVFEVFDDTTPLVEGISVDEAFLDVGGLRRIAGTPAEIAVRLRREVRERVGLAISVGVARTKFLAKVASARVQAGRTARRPARRGDRLPAPAADRAGLGRRRQDRRQVARPRDHTVGDIAAFPEEALVATLGPAAGPACARAGPQPRSPPGAHRPAAAVDRLAARPRPLRRAPRRPSTPCSSVSSTGSRGGCAGASGSAAR